MIDKADPLVAYGAAVADPRRLAHRSLVACRAEG